MLPYRHLAGALPSAFLAQLNKEYTTLNTMKAGVLALGLCALAAPAAAQTLQWTDKGFFAADGGVQVASHDLTTVAPFTLYDEDGTVTTSQKVKSGFLFDARGGYRVWRNMAVGLGYSHTGSNSNGSVTAAVPDPVVFGQPRTVTTSADKLSHSENALNLNATWIMPVTDKVDVGFTAGPTIFFVSQEVVGGVSVTEPGPSVTGTTIDKVSKTTAGINIGVDVSYMLNKRYGVGGLARYTWGSAKIENADLTLGGFQLGGGLRVRF